MSGNGNHNPNKGNRYSYSGADCKVFAYRGTREPMFLESVQTISFSIHEPRGRARALGFKGVKGFSRSVREIAGTMILTVIEDHPLAKLMTVESGGNYSQGWSVDGVSKGVGNLYGNQDFNGNISLNRIATTMPPFNLMLTYATEVISNPSTAFSHTEANWNPGIAPDLDSIYGRYEDASGGRAAVARDIDPSVDMDFPPASAEQLGFASTLNRRVRQTPMDSPTYFENSYRAKVDQFDQYNVSVAGLILEGIEIITEGIVTSVNDMITEIQIQFIARDYKEFSLGQYKSLSEVDLNLDLATEYLKEIYKKHHSWEEFESQLEEYEVDMNLQPGIYQGLGYTEYERETTFLDKVRYDPILDTFTLESQTSINRVLEFPTKTPRPEPPTGIVSDGLTNPIVDPNFEG